MQSKTWKIMLCNYVVYRVISIYKKLGSIIWHKKKNKFVYNYLINTAKQGKVVCYK